MRTLDDYTLTLTGKTASHHFQTAAQKAFDLVWRIDFTAPGFCLLDLCADLDSQELRHTMVALKQHLSDFAVQRAGQALVYRSMGRFDQQETTKFHLDGAPAASLLMLGYEPSPVRSRLLLADYSRCAFDLGIEPAQFLNDYNPMYRKGEEMLNRYVTVVPEAEIGHFRIALINNSTLPYSSDGTNPLGVMHKAEIINPTDSERRIVNSIMLAPGSGAGVEEISAEQIHAFAATDKISGKVYG